MMERSDVVELLSNWPQPSTGNDGPVVYYGRGPTRIAYDTAGDSVAVATFPICLQLTCGHPNDEVLQSHRLYGKGLQFYPVHRILQSARLADLERANAVHPRHDSASFIKDNEHWVFTFQDATVELFVLALADKKPSFTLCKSWKDAYEMLAEREA